jgi:hypothetical protein
MICRTIFLAERANVEMVPAAGNADSDQPDRRRSVGSLRARRANRHDSLALHAKLDELLRVDPVQSCHL